MICFTGIFKYGASATSFRSEEKFTLRDENFHIINILGGTGYKKANEICKEKGMMLFEPRDATINHMVWEKARESYPMLQNYWLNVVRSAIETGYDYNFKQLM